MHHHLRPFLAAALAAASAASAAATLIVDFTGDSTATGPSRSVSMTLGGSNPLTFSDDYAPGKVYFSSNLAESKTLPQLVGGSYVTYAGSGTATAFGPKNLSATENAANAQISLGNNPNADTTVTYQTLLMALQPDWQAGTSGTVSFDASSTLKVKAQIQQGTLGALNFVVLDGTTFYISTDVAGTSTGPNVTLTNPNAANWAVLDVSAGFGGIDANSITGTSHIFTDVKGVGLFLQLSQVGGGTNIFRHRIESWSVDAVAIPEPATAGLLAAGTALALAQFRRRR